MKFKEAAKSLSTTPSEEIPIALANLYHGELEQRANERWKSGEMPMAGFCILLKEMNEWIVKVCTGMGMPEYRGKQLMRSFNETAYEAAKLALYTGGTNES